MSGRKSLDETFLSTSNNPKRKKKLERVRSLKSLRSSTSDIQDFQLNSYRGSQVYTEFDAPKTDSIYDKVKENNFVKKLFSAQPKDKHHRSSNQDTLRLSGGLNFDEKYEPENCKLEGYDNSKVIKLQSFIRTINIKSTVGQFGKSKEKLELQYDAMFDFIDKEKKYVDLLQAIVESYYHSLTTSKIAILSPDKISIIFFNFEELYNYHKSFLSIIITQMEQWPNFNISKYLYEHFHKVLILYENFAFNLMNAETTVASVCQKRKFKNFLNQQRRITPIANSFPSFRAMISYPSKHISNYEAPCKKILINTQINSKNYQLLRDSVAIISQFSRYLKEQIEFNDCRSISSLLGNKRDLTARRRHFIRDSSIIVSGSQRLALLFTDILVIASKKKRRLKLEEIIPLKDATILSLKKTIDHRKTYFVIQRNFPKHIFECEEEGRFETSIARAICDQVKLANDQVFCVPLNELLEREKTTIPRILVKIIYFLDKQPNKAGLFRSMGNPSIITNMRLIESTPKGNDFSICHRDDIAALLGNFLDLLPDPLIKYNNLDPIYTTNVYNLKENSIIEYLGRTIESMSVNSRNLIEYISYFLQRLSSSGFLPSSELALFFAPLVIRSKEANHSYFYSLPNIIHIFDILIQKSDKIFVMKEKIRLPESIDEFFNSDSFCAWWKGFRSKDNQIISFITSERSLDQLFSHLIAIDNYLLQDGKSTHDPKFQRLQQFTSLSANVLSTDWISQVLFDNENFLKKFFKIFQSVKLEITKRYFVDILQCFFAHSFSFKFVDYFISNNELNEILIDEIGSGNVSIFLSKLTELSNMRQDLWKILNLWGVSAVHQLSLFLNNYNNNINSNDEYKRSCKIMNLSQFICGLLHYHDFISSNSSIEFFQTILSLFETTNLFDESLSNDETCIYFCNILIAIITKKLSYEDVEINMWGPDNLRDEADNNQAKEESIDQMKDDLLTQYSITIPSPIISRIGNNNEDIIENESPNHSNNNNNNNNNIAEKSQSPPCIPQHKRFFYTLIYQLYLMNPKEILFDVSPNLLTKLISQHEKMISLLNSPSSLFEAKLNVIQLIQSLIIVNSPIVLNILPNTNILQTLIEIVEKYPQCTIFHTTIRDIFHFLLNSKNPSIVSFIINDTPFIPNLIFHPFELKRKLSSKPHVNFFGQSLKLKTIIEENDVAFNIIKESQYKDSWSSSK